MFDIIAFDADDTLWHNEVLFTESQEKFRRILSRYRDDEWIERKLYETEARNLQYFGYGIKGFTLSMIETAVELTEGRVTGAEVGQIIDLAREMLKAPTRLLDHVAPTVAKLAEAHRLMIITKGDLFDQESKIARSGLGGHFDRIEIVSEKSRATYERIAARHGAAPDRFMMVGNSLKSDIFPVLEMGGRAVYIPYHTTWVHERVDDDGSDREGLYRLEHIGLLPALLEELAMLEGER